MELLIEGLTSGGGGAGESPEQTHGSEQHDFYSRTQQNNRNPDQWTDWRVEPHRTTGTLTNGRIAGRFG